VELCSWWARRQRDMRWPFHGMTIRRKFDTSDSNFGTMANK
jgi:hypothetical protein